MPLQDDNLSKEQRALGLAIRRLRLQAQLTQSAAAANMGVQTQEWQRWETGGRIPRRDRLPMIASAIGHTVDDLLSTREQIIRAPQPDPETGIAAMPGLVAVYGMAAGGNERLAITTGSEIRWVPMHPAQRGYKRIGAVEIAGESMYPRYKPRELAYFVFEMTPARGEDVLVELTNGEGLVKEYQGIKDGQLFLKEWHPVERVFSIAASTVKALHAIVR
jgi:phage repressor protein C with HTH and peptisase S24 domain